ncbi:MAG: histidine kinase [Solobacterium sp.]|nr:histidine kinase [Solobacterium sp.]
MSEKKYSTKKTRSVRAQILAAITFVQIPVVILYFFVVSSFISHFVEEQWNYQNDELKRYISNLQEETQNIDEFLYGDCYYLLREKDTAVLLTKLTDAADTLMNNNKVITAIEIYDPEDTLFLGTGDEEIQKAVSTYFDDGITTSWKRIEYNKEYYLMRPVRENGYTAVAVVSLRRLAATASNVYHIRGTILLEQNGTYFNRTLWQRLTSEEIPDSIPTSFILNVRGRRYMLSESTLLGMRAVYGTIYTYDFSWLYYFGYFLLALAAVSIVITAYYLTRSVIRPLNRMTGVMDQIKDGDLDLRLAEEKSTELQKISGTFNEMMDHLEDAKIESYEHQLAARKAKLGALRLQIRRHFFLNCLKNIYAMASTGDMAGVKQTALLLSTNLRYTLNFENDAVELRQELAMCEDYIKLQGIGQPVKPMLVIESDPALEMFMIPPVSLLTILENSCKYGTKTDSPLVIRIHTEIRELDEKKYAIITVRDNGNGYSKEMLQLLNQNLKEASEKNHIGMANTLVRFQLLYGEECSVLFSNSGGAKVDLMIPMERIGDDHETADRG